MIPKLLLLLQLLKLPERNEILLRQLSSPVALGRMTRAGCINTNADLCQ